MVVRFRGQDGAGAFVAAHDDFQQFFSSGEWQLAHAQIVDDQQGYGHQELHVLFAGAIACGVGQAARLLSRLWSHANQPASRYYNFWNYFSAFAVANVTVRSQLEGVLIAAMPTANGAKPKIRKAQLPLDVRKYLHKRLHPTLQFKMMAMPATKT